MYTMSRASVSACFFILAELISGATPAEAAEMEAIAQCDRALCGILRTPGADGPPLRCDVGWMFYKEQIEKVARSKRLIWPLGDARCTVKLDIERALIARAMTQDRYTLKPPRQPASCEVEYRGERYPITMQLAPEIQFDHGRATSIKLGVQDIQANIVMKALLWSAARLESNFGLFQTDFLTALNSYVEQHCRAKPTGRRQVRIDAPPVRAR